MARKVVPRASSEQTREKILTVAQKLFADAGFDAVSMRQGGGEADVPFALVTYHFKTKLGLYKAVFKQWGETISAQRMAQLQSIELGEDAYGNFLAIAKALVEPMMRLRQMKHGRDFVRLIAREVHDPVENERGIVEEYLDPVARMTIDILREAAPDVPLPRCYWAYHFAVGALAVNYTDSGRLERISGNICTLDNLAELTEEATHFIAAGLMSVLRRNSLKQTG